MAIAQEIYEFFGWDVLSSSATFTDLISYLSMIFCGMWAIIFMIRSIFMMCRLPERRLF